MAHADVARSCRVSDPDGVTQVGVAQRGRADLLVNPEPGQGGDATPATFLVGNLTAGGRKPSAGFSVRWAQEGFAHG